MPIVIESVSIEEFVNWLSSKSSGIDLVDDSIRKIKDGYLAGINNEM
jgi:hypothetical protein